MGRFLIHIDAQDAQDFFRRRLACVPGHPQIRTRSLPESASPAAASRPDYPVHPVHRCSIYSPSRWICPVAGGGRPAHRQTGVSQRGQAGFQRSRPPDTPHLTIGTTPPGSAGVPPACCPFGCRSVSLRCCSRPPCRREPHGPGRSRGRAPLPVDSGGGDGRSCGRICAGGTPALPGGLPPMTGSHQRDKSAEAFWRQLSLKEVHQSSCLKQKKKELSTKGHEERRRATKALRLTATGYQGHERIIDFRLFRSRMIRTAGRGPG